MQDLKDENKFLQSGEEEYIENNWSAAQIEGDMHVITLKRARPFLNKNHR